MSTDRFHKAAKDGNIEILKEATRKECNGRDEQGMTPTLYAAFYGNLDALRVLCGRGGDPDKADLFGNTALHLAAAQGHKSIVTFLVNFDCNIFALDIDRHTAQELAGMHNREDILRFLDGVRAKIEAEDKKKAKAMREKAAKDADKRIKKFNKKQAKDERRTSKEQHRPSVIETLKLRIKSGSTSNLVGVGASGAASSSTVGPRPSFSAIVGGGTLSGKNMGTVQRKALANKNSRLGTIDDDFKVSEIEDGKRSVRSLRGYRRDSEVLYSGTLDGTKRGRLDGIFNDAEYNGLQKSTVNGGGGPLTRSLSQPDFVQELQRENGFGGKIHQEPASIFVRPGIGSLAFRKSITNTLQALSAAETATEESSIGSAGSLRHNIGNYEDDLSDVSESSEENPNAPLEMFLSAWGLKEYLPRFEEQKIDLETLMLLTENDMKTLNLPLGPYRKLVTAVNKRKAALENPGEVIDSML